MTASPSPTAATADRPFVRMSSLRVLTPHGRAVLDGVDMDVRQGTVTALTGESGSGKTTLLHALLGHLGPGLSVSAGDVDVKGHDPFTRSGARRLRGRVIGYLPQDPAAALDPRRSVGSQLATAARVAHPREGRRSRLDRVREAATTAALDHDLLSRRPGRLSGGQAQRVLITWVLVTRPRVILLDEPTSGLDADTARRVVSAVTTLPWRPAVLVVTHDLDLIARHCDSVLRLVDGRLLPAEVGPGGHDPQAPDGPDGLGRDPAADRTLPATASPCSRRPPMRALAARDVTIVRGGTTVVYNQSLHLDTGELVALRGRSGAGKTSLARAVSGLTPPESGRLSVQGVAVPWEAGARVRGGHPFVAYVGQDARAALHPQETPHRTLNRAAAAARRRRCAGDGAPEDPLDGGAVDLLDRFGLPPDVLDRTPEKLSGGQRHRVLLARAVAAAPTVLVCDETTAALDHPTVARVLDALDLLRRETGLAVLFITHQNSVTSRADRVLTLTGGRLI